MGKVVDNGDEQIPVFVETHESRLIDKSKK